MSCVGQCGWGLCCRVYAWGESRFSSLSQTRRQEVLQSRPQFPSAPQTTAMSLNTAAPLISTPLWLTVSLNEISWIFTSGVLGSLSWVLCAAWNEWRRSKDNRGWRILLLQKTCSLPGGLPVCQRLWCRIHCFHYLKSPCMDTSWLRLYAGYSS